MKLAVTVLLSAALSVQPVYAISAEPVRYEDIQEGEAAQEEAEGPEEDGAQEETGTGAQEEISGNVELNAPSAILMEASTGQIIYEKDADTKRPPASVTKV